jgi:hypothetical protein
MSEKFNGDGMLKKIAMGAGALAATEGMSNNEVEAAPRDRTERAKVAPAEAQEKVLSTKELEKGVNEISDFIISEEGLKEYTIKFGALNNTEIGFDGKLYPFVKDSFVSKMVKEFNAHEKKLQEISISKLTDDQKELEMLKVKIQRHRDLKNALEKMCK